MRDSVHSFLAMLAASLALSFRVVAGEGAVESPYADLGGADRQRLLEMGMCARTAYYRPGGLPVVLPKGYRPFSGREWAAVSARAKTKDGVYSADGYFGLRNGLRGRFMVHVPSGRTVIAWSGCDTIVGDDADFEGLKDILASASHLLFKNTFLQYNQALDISRAILSERPGKTWIVGHSLGGSITAYIAARLEEKAGDVEYATFNALGVTGTIADGMDAASLARCESHLVNVYCNNDPIYNNFPTNKVPVRDSERFAQKLARGLLDFPLVSLPRHLGKSYCLKYQVLDESLPNAAEVSDLVERLKPWTYFHSINELIRQMELHDRPCVTWTVVSCTVAGFIGAIVLVLLAFCLWRRLRAGRRDIGRYDGSLMSEGK